MAISYIGGNANTFVTDTSQTIVIPSSAAVGDLLVLWVMCRSALTIPPGWKVIDTKTTPLSSNQTLYMLSKTCESGDIGANLTVTQAVSNRMSVHVQIFRGDAFRMLAVKSIYTDNKSANTIAIPTLSTLESGDLIVAAATASLQQGNNLTPPSGYTQTTAAAPADNRMCAAYLLPTHPYTTTGTFTFDFTAAANGIVTIAALISEEDFNPSAYSYEITISSGKVSADLTDFPFIVDLSLMDGTFWDNVRFDGGDLRATDASATDIPLDLIYIDPSTKTGIVIVKVPTVTAAADTVFYINGDGISDRLASNNANGRNAVWSDYHTSIWTQGGYFNRVDDTFATNVGIITCGTGDWLTVNKNGNLYWSYAGAPPNNAFTLGSYSTIITRGGGDQAIIDYRGSSTHIAFYYADAGKFALWNTTDGFLFAGPNTVSNTEYKHTARYNYPTQRDITLSGVATVVDSTITQVPTGTSYSFNIASANTTSSARLSGTIQYAYLRLDLLSDAWIAAEYGNRTDATFYSVAYVAPPSPVSPASPSLSPSPSPASPGLPSPASPVSPLSPGASPSPALSPSPASPTSPGTPSPAGDPAYVTQLPILLVDATVNRPTRVTQLPILVLFAEYQPTRITQMPVMPLYTVKPVPLPKVVIPETPVKESWIWKTTVKETHTGKEQRTRLREYPRYRMTFNALIETEDDRRIIYAMLMRFIKQTFVYPMFQYNAHLTAGASVGSTKLYCDTARTDLRAGEQLALFDPYLEQIHYMEIDTVDADGVNLVEPLAFDVLTNWQVCPAIMFRTSPGTGFNMNNITGNFEIMMESVLPRVFVRPTAAPTIITKGGITIVPDRHLSGNGIDETFQMGIDWLDNGTAIPEAFAHWKNPLLSGSRVYRFNRHTQMDYWRKLCDTFKGRQNVGLFPTFRQDIDLRAVPALGTKTITTNNIELLNYWLGENYRYVRIETVNGVSYNKILDVQPVYDDDGYPYYATILFETALGTNAGDNDIKAISFMNLCRIDTDSIDLTHFSQYSEITLPIRAVNA